MTLTRTDIVRNVMERVRFKRRNKSQQQFLFPEMDCLFLSRKRATEIVNTLFETIKKTLASGDDVRISGFGKFQVRFKWARRGRNPQTGDMIILRSRRTVTFRVSPRLREKINLPRQDSNL
jgi:integration host factor subunit alpha